MSREFSPAASACRIACISLPWAAEGGRGGRGGITYDPEDVLWGLMRSFVDSVGTSEVPKRDVEGRGGAQRAVELFVQSCGRMQNSLYFLGLGGPGRHGRRGEITWDPEGVLWGPMPIFVDPVGTFEVPKREVEGRGGAQRAVELFVQSCGRMQNSLYFLALGGPGRHGRRGEITWDPEGVLWGSGFPGSVVCLLSDGALLPVKRDNEISVRSCVSLLNSLVFLGLGGSGRRGDLRGPRKGS
eukprot:gene16223-biopygen5025